MEQESSLSVLFNYALTYNFDKFNGLFEELEFRFPQEQFSEAYLMRAQIKLFATDITAADDLEKGMRFIKTPKYPFLDTLWNPDSATQFVVFPKTAGAVREFLRVLPKMREKMDQLYGVCGDAAVRRIQYELYYFIGETEKALDYMVQHPNQMISNYKDRIYMMCVFFRCYLAAGKANGAEKIRMKMIQLSQQDSKCQMVYEEFRKWANLTTGWSGDSPRFYNSSEGIRLPVMKDRLDAVRNGIARSRYFESQFIAYAVSAYEDVYTMRQYYMDIFRAMYWLLLEDYEQVKYCFEKLYKIARSSCLIMPFVECGEHITPLLQYAQESGIPGSGVWAARVSTLASKYEENLNIYRALESV